MGLRTTRFLLGAWMRQRKDQETHVHKSRDTATIGRVASAAMLVVISTSSGVPPKNKTFPPAARAYALMGQSNSTQTTYDGKVARCYP